MDDGSPVDVIYLDFQKSFDKVPHQRLIRKLKSHAMGNSIINWVEQWLTDRRQRVIVDGEVSSWKSVLSGVPRGSVGETGASCYNFHSKSIFHKNIQARDFFRRDPVI